jgi:hypothetical protein
MPQNNTRSDRRSFTALLTICCLVTFGCYFAVSMRLPVMPLYARGFGISTSQIGVINAAFYLMAGSIGLGPLMEAVGFAYGFLLAGVFNLFFVAFFAWSIVGFSRGETVTNTINR